METDLAAIVPAGASAMEAMLLMTQDRVDRLEKDAELLRAVRRTDGKWARRAGDGVLDFQMVRTIQAAGLDGRIVYRSTLRPEDGRTPAYELRHDPRSGRLVGGWNADSLEGGPCPFLLVPRQSMPAGNIAVELRHTMCCIVHIPNDWWDDWNDDDRDACWYGQDGWTAFGVEAFDSSRPAEAQEAQMA